METSENNFLEAVDPDQVMLDKINKIFEAFNLTVRQRRLGEEIEGCEGLKGKKIVMVDDLVDVLKSFVADLMVATDGNAKFILHNNQTEESLVKEILEKNPDIILMDKNLANGLNGTEVIKSILRNRPEAICAGFSSESHSQKEFLAAGAKGFVSKNTGDPETIRNIAKLVN